MFSTLIRFTLITLISIAAVMAILGITGMLSSSEIWSNLTKVGGIAAVILIASAAILLVSNKK